MAYEDDLVKKVKGAILGFKNGTKTAKDVNEKLASLREKNSELAKDYNAEFVSVARAKNPK